MNFEQIYLVKKSISYENEVCKQNISWKYKQFASLGSYFILVLGKTV